MTVSERKDKPIAAQRWRRLISLGLLIGVLGGCQSQASNEQLDQWHREAIAENDRLAKANVSDLTKDWKLTIQGQTQKTVTLNWSQLEALATTSYSSQKPYPDSPKTPFEFRGVSVMPLLNQAGILPDEQQVTIVAADAYYATMPIKDFVKHQGMLAIAENGKPIRRNDGGPLHMVFHSNPNGKVNERAITQTEWVYYVTHLIVGTETLKLKVGQKTLGLADLERLPSHKLTTLVGYKIGWNADPVQLIGVKVQDVLRSQNIQLPPDSSLKIRRKSMDDRDPQKSVLIPAKVLQSCDVLLAYQWGPDAQPILASKGGPLTLAYGKNCTSETVKNLAWLPFVESLSVESKGVKP
jgi:hypothetical protein